MTHKDIDQMVDDDPKGRYATCLNELHQKMIRANQGHSGDTVTLRDLCGEPIQGLKDHEICIHGTKRRHVPGIVWNDLKVGGERGSSFRNSMHMAVALPGKGERVVFVKTVR